MQLEAHGRVGSDAVCAFNCNTGSCCGDIIFDIWTSEVIPKVSSLEAFDKEGKINKDLKFYLGKASPEQQAQFRKALLQRAEISPVLLSRFFYTQIGEDILTRLGKLTNI